MEIQTSNEYLLSATAIRVWKANDKEGENTMLVAVSTICKGKWFKSIIYKSDTIPAYRLEEIAEEAFYISWQRFNARGKAGAIIFTDVEYTGYLKQAFHRTFIRMYKKEIKENEEKKLFFEYYKTMNKNGDDAIRKELLKQKLQRVLQTLPAESVSLMKWRYINKLSYKVIAEKMQILEQSCTQKLYRAKKEFKEAWKKYNKQL